MYALIDTALYILEIYWFIVIAAVIMSWLLNFNVINRYNRFVRMIADGLEAMTEPLLSRIRRVIPNPRGVDISPLVLLIIIFFLERLISVDLLRGY
jgi:YggT family protein